MAEQNQRRDERREAASAGWAWSGAQARTGPRPLGHCRRWAGCGGISAGRSACRSAGSGRQETPVDPPGAAGPPRPSPVPSQPEGEVSPREGTERIWCRKRLRCVRGEGQFAFVSLALGAPQIFERDRRRVSGLLLGGGGSTHCGSEMVRSQGSVVARSRVVRGPSALSQLETPPFPAPPPGG